MKTCILLLTCVGLLALPACAQITNGYEWKATIRVVDESGVPMPGVSTAIGYYTNSVSTSTDGITDTNGVFTLSHTARSEYADISLEAKRDGYYSVWQQVNLQAPFEASKWNLTKTLTLKKVGKPIAMYAKWIRKNPPVINQPIGYDLMVGDWVGPYGKGVQTDIIFQAEDYRKSSFDYAHNITITFPKMGDGIQVYAVPEAENGSDLRSPPEAPVDGYQTGLLRGTSAHPGQPSKNEYDPNRIYLFRVRTALDHEGHVVSAHYGKIYGDFMQFSYYLNPTPNDRNIEFDPKQNLLGGLRSFEQVSAP